MAIVYSYPRTQPELQDLLIGTEMSEQGGEDIPKTRTFTIGSILNLITPVVDTNYVKNTADTYISTPKIEQIVTLTAAEYAAITIKNINTIYILI